MNSVEQIYNSAKAIVPKKQKVLTPDEAKKLFLKTKDAKPSKYRNKWVEIDGIKFQSTGEGNYYVELKRLKLSGEIKDFKRQVAFPLEVNGVHINNYVSDFVIQHFNGTYEIVDYKSRFTVTLALYQMKKALVKALYGYTIKEVGNK